MTILPYIMRHSTALLFLVAAVSSQLGDACDCPEPSPDEEGNYIVPCICDGVVQATWKIADPRIEDMVAIYRCTDADIGYRKQPITFNWACGEFGRCVSNSGTSVFDTDRGLTSVHPDFEWPIPACECLTAVYQRGDTVGGSPPPYIFVSQSENFQQFDNTCPPPQPTPDPDEDPDPVDPDDGKVSGDPHFQSWNGIRFNYHGECDLVMVHSDGFANGLGLDVHLRTKIVWDVYKTRPTHIERAAIKIGDNVFEVMNDKHWFNGKEGVDLPLSLSGFNVTLYHAPPNTKQTDHYVIDLGSGARVVMGSYIKYMAVHVFAGRDDRFSDAVGLLGNKKTGAFLGRDGVTEYTLDNIDDFGGEWQVQPDEPSLFVDGTPRKKCYVAGRSAEKTARKLRAKDPALTEAAEEVCSSYFTHPDDVEACVFDVVVTGDFEFAEAHGQMHKFAHGLGN